jgi:hypothetical protein
VALAIGAVIPGRAINQAIAIKMISRLPTPIETRWLDYAIKVLNDASHRAVCESKETEGAHGTPKLDKSLRWPGYLGSEYERSPLRVLCVAQVHHASELYRTLGHLQSTLRSLRSQHAP